MSAVSLRIGSLEPTRREQGEWAGLSAAFLVALSLHAGAFLAVAVWRSTTAVSPPGEQPITVDLAPQMAKAASVAPVETSVPAGDPAEAPPVDAPPDVAAPAPAEPPVDSLPPPTAVLAEAEPPPPVPATPTAEEVAPIASTAVDAPAVAAALPPPGPVQARPLREPRRAPAPKPVERRPEPKPVREPVQRERPVQTAARPGAAGESRREAARGASSRENAGGSAASAYPQALGRYAAQIASALKARLRYPEAARAAGAGGVATLRFTIHRSGRVVSATLVRSAGHPALDAAALATAAPGSAVPAAPDAVPQAQLTFSVPLRFTR